MGEDGVQILGQLKTLCANTSVECDIPDEISLQLHHLAGICADAINGAHTNHCVLSQVLRNEFDYKEKDRVGIDKPIPQKTTEEQVQLPTEIRCWKDASSGVSQHTPIGLAIRRRRFDSWQLNSGKGRFDVSPTRDNRWEHPIEENPVCEQIFSPSETFFFPPGKKKKKKNSLLTTLRIFNSR